MPRFIEYFKTKFKVPKSISIEQTIDMVASLSKKKEFIKLLVEFSQISAECNIEAQRIAAAINFEATKEKEILDAFCPLYTSSGELKNLEISDNKNIDRRLFSASMIFAEYSKEKYPEPIMPDAFSNMTYSELMFQFKPEIFLDMTPTKQLDLCQALSIAYIKKYYSSAKACQVDAGKLSSQGGYCNGSYYASEGRIVLNEESFIKASRTKNPMEVLKIMDTVLHETKHRAQFQMLDKREELNNQDKYVEDMLLLSLESPIENETKDDYFGAPEELDARNAALAEIRKMVESKMAYPALIDYYNAALVRERSLASKYNLGSAASKLSQKSPAPIHAIQNSGDARKFHKICFLELNRNSITVNEDER